MFEGSYRVGSRNFVCRAAETGVDAEGQRNLTSQGLMVPALHHAGWPREPDITPLLAEAWENDRCCAQAVVDESVGRALPGSRLWRVERFGGFPDVEALEALIQALADFAQRRSNVLRLSVGFHERSAALRERLVATARGLNFTRAPQPRAYRFTQSIDLKRSPEDIRAGMRGTGRRHLRQNERAGVDVRPVTEARYATRLDALVRETMERTGGRHEDHDWKGRLAFAETHPGQASILGAFSEGQMGPEALLAFAIGLRHGDHVVYSTAASTRYGVDFPVGYGLAWRLILWAQEVGADWFDFGGMPERDDPDSPLQGIARFKRSFGGELVEVGDEWLCVPRPLRERASSGVSAVARVVRRLAQAD